MSSQKKEPESKETELEHAIPTVSQESRPDQAFHHNTRTSRRIITEREAWDHTAFSYTWHRKWTILLILWMIQIAMNMNGSIWANTAAGLSSHYDIPINRVSFGNMAFLMSYAFGCEIWAPWSEELGRKWLMQASLLLVSIFTAMVPFAPSFTIVIFLRLLTGLATAGGSLTLGVVADMYKENEQQNAVSFVAWGSMLGSSLPPMIGGIMENYLGADSRRWCFWFISFCGIFVQLWHLFFVPETYYKKALNNCAKRRRGKARQEGNESLDSQLYGPTEGIPLRERFKAKEIGVTMWRPFKFLLVSDCPGHAQCENHVLIQKPIDGAHCLHSFRTVCSWRCHCISLHGSFWAYIWRGIWHEQDGSRLGVYFPHCGL